MWNIYWQGALKQKGMQQVGHKIRVNVINTNTASLRPGKTSQFL
jgi:hypothetical protein